MMFPPPVDMFKAAADLLSESGENPEYDRAILELTTILLGLPEEARPHVATTLQRMVHK